ncbi:MAG: transcription-repair coupling factor [Tissierellia bacterium]|nr:transcription-repair coupling factor [Tissierellia bacterium]
MTKPYLDPILDQSPPFKTLREALGDRDFSLGLYGLPAGGISLVTRVLLEESNRPILLVTYDPDRAKKIQEDLTWYLEGGVYNLPGRDLFFFRQEAGSKELLKTRLESLQAMASDRARVVVTSLEALAGYYLPGQVYDQAKLGLKIGDSLGMEALLDQLLFLGYQRVDQVEAMGQFALRGGILDIFTPSDQPYRIEFFDIEIDSIRTFDPKSQRSVESLEALEIFPVSDLLLSPDQARVMAKRIREDLDKDLGQDDLAKDRAQEKFLPILERLEAGEVPANTDLLLPYLAPEDQSGLLSYFKTRPLIFLDEPKKLFDQMEKEEEDLKDKLGHYLQAGEALAGHCHIQRTSSSLRARLAEEDLALSYAFIRGDSLFRVQGVINFQMRSLTAYQGRIKDFKEEMGAYLARDYRILVLAGSKDKTQRMLDNLKDLGLPAQALKEEAKDLRPGQVYVARGAFHSGLDMPGDHFILINASEIYGQGSQKKRRKKKRPALDPRGLKKGDYVIHETHGIGRYEGTHQLEVQGTTRDYLTISYLGEDRVFLPMDQLSMIYKYTASEGQAPKLNRLDSPAWKKTKSKAKKSVEVMAKDLIRLYGERAQLDGYPFSPDTPWQKEFEDSFPFEETQGQVEAIQEIKEDMEETSPMDRLLCADVGYGKTEVALRAAFKAIMDGKQVAFLVPTTILAQQHYNTIRERFFRFPIKVGQLSRFVEKKDQKETIQGLKKGTVDLVVGTHRLLSKDIDFKDLGLLIIDEEQRFGVKHKEKLKLLKKNVDTLTLTATPIPRTLQMSMGGIRDISVINEPPQERFPVQTYVVEYNPVMVRDAILKELDRGGQVFFVYNRVQTMDQMVYDLKKLVPEARIDMANGQMSERQLEDTMLRFIQQEIDVLVSSTIIETGMDIPNANTMILWEANRLGLSQLYQLRGRIGRSNRVAYAYFTYRPHASMSELAEKRLRAISEFTEFGSGYQIALRDLEIRGSGNILGESQHGHMEAIGYELYMKLLRRAVGKLQGKEEEEGPQTSLDLAVDAFIPKAYIRNEKLRLDMYKKVAILEDEEDLEDLLDEFIDRFGDPPRALMNLLKTALLRAQASNLGLESIKETKDNYHFTMAPGYELDLALINELTQAYGSQLKFSRGDRPAFSIKSDQAPLDLVEKLLQFMKLHKKNTHKEG